MMLFLCGIRKHYGLYYIGGSDILPPPLKGQQEQEALEALERGDEAAKQRLVEHMDTAVPGRVFIRNGSGGILGAVVNEHNFIIIAAAGKGGQHRLLERGHILRLVIARDNQG